MTSDLTPNCFDFSIPEAQWLSDLSGVDADLDAVLRLCMRFETEARRLSSIPKNGAVAWWEEIQTAGDIFFAAVVRYGRTLTSGVRRGIPIEWIEALSQDLQDTHGYFKTLRDKFIAHSVNRLEDNQVLVILMADYGEVEVPAHITVERGRLVTPSLKEVDSLRRLVAALKTRVGAEIEAETARLLQLALAMPIEQIKQRGTDDVPIPNRSDTFRNRQNFE